MPTEQELAEYLRRVAADLHRTRQRLRSVEERAHEPIALVGMACRYPGGITSPADLWRLVADGTDAVTPFPQDRGWETEAAGHSREGGFLTGAADFDADFFGISPREALAMDPQQRHLLEVSWEALESTGLDPAGLRGSDTGVFVGMYYQDYESRLADVHAGGYGMTGNTSSVASGRVAYTFGLEGPAITIDTACSSSLVAMHLAAQALRNGECSLALAGGVAVMATPAVFTEFALQGGLASDGRCKAYSADADGTGWGEGVGMLVLERLSEAQRLGHPVLAVLRGSAVNQDGASNGLSAPNGPAQERVIRAALAGAKLSTADVDVVEGHGTGTRLGDPIEAQALLATYGQNRPGDRPLWLGSIKSNIGHTQAAAGVAGVIKMVEAMRHGTLPATLHAGTPSAHVSWASGDVRLLTEARPWEPADRPRRAGVSSFGISGTNAHVILEEAPEPQPVQASGEPPVVTGAVVPWVLSARSADALRALADRLAAGVPAQADLAEVAGALARGRAGLEFRAVALGADRAELTQGLAAVEPVGPAARGKVAWVFPGQGAQWVGMGRELAAASPVFAGKLDEVCAVADPLLGRSLRELMFSSAEVHQTAFTQIAVFAFEVALAAVAEAAGLQPDFVAGHSVGEVTAAHVAGALSLDDAVRLLVARGALMQALPPGGVMAAVQAGESEVDLSGLADRVAVAAVNSATGVVLSGAREAVEEAVARLGERKVRWLEVSHAFHSPLMHPIVDDLERAVAGISFAEPRVPMVSAVTGVVVGVAALGDPAHWVRQAVGTVRFHDVVTFLHDRGTAGFLELGPDQVLSGVWSEGWTAGLAERDDAGARRLLRGLARAWTHGATVDWARLVPAGRPTALPAYPFQHRRFWPAGSGAATGLGAAGLTAAAHPLLAAVVTLADSGEWLFTGRLSGTGASWLADHELLGVTVVPAAALADLVLFAGERAGRPMIQEITFERPLALARRATVDLQISVRGDHATISSRPVGEESWTRHATATLADDLADEPESGPDDRDVLVQAPADDEQDGFGIHPGLLHAMLNLGPDEVPERWEGVRLFAVGARQLRVRTAGSGLLAVDGDGRPVVHIRAMTTRRVTADEFTRGQGRLLGVSWESLPMRPAGPATWSVLRPGDALTMPDSEPATVLALCDGEDPVSWVLGIVQEWTAADRPAGSRLIVTTRGAVPADPQDAVPGLAQAPIWGLVRSARAEHPDAGLVLLDDDGHEASGGALPAAVAAAAGEPELAVRRGDLLVPRLRPAAPDQSATTTRADGTMLITGGTGTLGGLIARHLVARHGVRSLVLASRSGPAAPGAEALAADLAAAGARVRIVAADLADRTAVDALVAGIPDLTGVVHTAGLTEDTLLATLTPESLTRVLAAKAGSAQHLHEATLDRDLTTFVLFSSLAGLIGSPGQGNYAAANAYLDALAAHRRATGRPGLSIAWYLWEQRSTISTGLTDSDRARLARSGAPLPTDTALSLFDSALATRETLAAAGLDLAAVRAGRSAGMPEVALLRGLVRAPRRTAADSALGRRLGDRPTAEQQRLLLSLVREQAALVLGHRDAAGIPADRAFRDLGFGSLTAVELRNRLATATGLTLPATVVFDYPTAQALAGYLLRRVSGATDSPAEQRPARSAGEPIAIVSMACRFPGGVGSPEELWRLVVGGVDAMGPFPADRGWETGAGEYERVGGFLSGMADFDAAFFGISPREAVAMDPQQRLLLEVSWEALERAGLDPAGLRGSDTGVFAGLAMQDYSSRLPAGDSGGFGLTGNASSVVSGRVAYTFGLEGPAVTVDTACSSSLVAMHLAAQALRNGECSLALAGGVTVLATEGIFTEFSRQGGLAADGRCKPFSAAADGTGWGEGVGVVLLERLSEAQRLGHPVLAVLKGSAVNQDGASNGLSAPNGPSQERVIRRALADAELTPAEVDVTEAHGTGTALGDPIEATALLATYGQDRPEGKPLWLGSVKSNIGHTQAAAGIAGVIKMVEAMRHETLPPTLHADEPSPHVDWATGDVRLLTEARPWEADGRPRRAGVSSFGISGTNAHLILEQAPAMPTPSRTGVPVVTGGLVPWAFSARSEPALQVLAERLVAVEAASEDVAVSLAVSRTGLEFRGVLLEPDAPLVSGQAVDGDVAFVFPGQGSQWLGMGRELMASSPVFADFVAECEQLVDFPLRDALVSGTGLDRVEVVQPALFVMMVGLAKVWEAAGVTPSAVVGHSQGELAAACFAGVLSLRDALGLVVARSCALVALAGTGGMLSVAADPETVDGMLADGLVIAAINASSQVVVSGAPQALDALAARCEAAGIRARRVDVDYASHNPLVDPVREQLLAVPVSPREGRLPFYSAVTGTLVDGAGLDAAYWWRNLREQVRFAQTVAAMPVAGFVEVSPHPVLMQGIEDRWAVGSLRRDDGGQRRLLTSLAEAWTHGASVEWSRLVPAGRAVTLPTYPFEHRRYWAAGGGVRGGVGHPLLESVVRLAEDTGWVLSGRVSAGISPWLADHAVLGTVLVPGAALAELVLFAGDRAGLPVIGEITFEQPFVLDDAVDVQVRVDDDRVGVFSRRGERWVRHASATLAGSGGPVEPLAGEWPPSGAQVVPVADAYEVMAARGYEYGPAFRGLQAAWRLGEELYAEVELPVEDGFAIHPALLDATSHVLIAAAGDGASLGLPFAWRDVQLHATGASALRVRVSPAGPDSYSLLAVDGAGRPVVSAAAMTTRPADPGLLTPSGSGVGLMSLAWVPVTAGPAPEQDWVREWPSDPAEPVFALAEPADPQAALTVVQAWLEAGCPAGSRLVVRTRGAVAAADGDLVPGLESAGVWGLVRSAQSEHPDAGLILVDGDGSVDAAVAAGEREFALRGEAVLVPRLRSASDQLELPVGSQAWRLGWAAGGDLDRVQAVSAPDAERPLGAHEVRVAVRAAGVNFRDLLSALGLLPHDTRPPGNDGAGIVTEVGTEVTGLTPGMRVMGMFAAFGPLAVADARLVVPVPDGWSDAEAAATPTAYLTAHHALFDLGRVQAGDRVLIHAASGGVGIAAVRLALAAGAEVFATASPAKQAVVAELGVRHVASSRTAEFAAVFGQVDVVLNSLTGELLDASLGMLAEGGRFVELGKTDIRDPRQVPFDVAELDPDKLAEIWRLVLEQVVPLPVTVFPMAQAGAALRFMSQARHVGKIVLRVPGVGDGTVLITGGTGTLGGLVARHLVVRHGVRDVVLVSRSGPDAPGAAGLSVELEALGARVRVVATDLTDRAAVEALVARIPGLTGVVHAAGVLEDTSLASLSVESLSRVLAAKAKTAWHLHEATRGRDLRMFVLFSSLAGLLGNPGQGNYAAANTYLDALAEHRAALGLPAVSIAWGLWEQTSAMTAGVTGTGRARLARSGGVVLRTEEALDLLDRAITAGRPVVAAGLDVGAVRDVIATGAPVPAVLLGLGRARRRAAVAGAGGGALARRLAVVPLAERVRVVLDLVREHAGVVLGHVGGVVAADRAFRDLGFDSLTAVELRNRLAAASGLSLPATLVFDYPTPRVLAEYLVAQVTGTAAAVVDVAPASGASDEQIAIVSMACRFPGGVSSPEELWQLVAGGVDAMGPFPADRGWETETAGYARVGGFLAGAADFDAEFFGISPREAVAMDPQQRLLLEVSWEALERAGLDPAGLRGSDTGVFAGLYYHGYGAQLPDGDGSGFRLTGYSTSVASGRVSYALGLEGPAVTIDTACSSSLVAMHLAAQALRNGECSLALAGGVAVMAGPAAFAEFAQQGGLAADGRSKPFSDNADGTGWGEGVGVLVLERLSEAQRLGHPVLAVLKGSAVNQDGASNGLSAPNGPSQQRVIRAALAAAGLSTADVDVAEAHGTGTTLGDPIEAQALLATYGQDRPEGKPLWLGSVKSNIGHTQAAAGVAGVIKMVEAMRHGTLPATLNAGTPSRHVDWTAGDVRLLTEARPWEADGQPRRAGVSAFGLSGTNAHVILEEAPEQSSSPAPADPVVTGGLVPWAFSARSEPALQVLAERLVAVEAASEDVAVSLAVSRTGLEFRGVLLEPGTPLVSGQVADGDGVAFVFPGQGSQWLGMGRELLASSPVFADFVAECEQLVDFPLRDALVSGAGLTRVEVVQPALFVMMVGLAKVWEAAGVTPSAVVGHSQGELAAACFAGALSLPDALGLAVARSQALVALAGTGGMLSVAADPETVDGLLADDVVIAAINASSQVVVSGAPQALDALAARCEAAGIRARRVDVDYASHHPLVERVRDQLLAVEVSPREGRLPFYSAVTGSAVDGASLDAGYWWRNLREQVKFAQTVAAMPVSGFVEVSPHPVLVQGIEGRWAVGSLRRDDGGQRRLLTSLAEAWTHGATVDWTRLVPAGRQVVLPTYPFQHRRYWAAGGSGARGSVGHPLLESVVRLAEDAGWVWSGRLSTGTSPWLGDHVVAGRTLAPGAALTELVLHAGDRAGLPAIAEIAFEQPLVLDGLVEVQVRVEENRASVFSRSGEQWIRHATAALTDPVEPTEALDGQWPPAGAQAVPIDDAYEAMAARGYEYGPAFRGLQAVWRLGEDLYAEVELPVDDGFALHPALLDSALHALLVVAGDDDAIGLPFAWRDVHLYATGASALRVRLRPTGPDTVSLLAADGAGQPVVSTGAMISRPAEANPLAPALSAGAGLLALGWVPARAAQATADSPPYTLAEPVDVPAALALVQDWLGEEHADGARLVIRTRNAVAAVEGDPVEGLATAGVWGLVRSAMAEHPDAGLVLLDDDGNDGLVEAALATGERELALRNGAVLVPRLRRSAVADEPVAVLDPAGTVLVTGGTGTLGGLVARHLADRHGIRDLVLVSRSGPDASGAGELLAELAATGARVRIVAADLSDRAVVDALVADLPGLTAVIHAAGVVEDAPVTSLTEPALGRVLAAKAVSAWHLHEATADRELQAFVLFSSLSGLLGGAGQGNYTAANTYLDALAAHRRARGRAGVSIAWGFWEQRSTIGAGVTDADLARLARAGGTMLPVDRALSLFDQALRADSPVVATGLDVAAVRSAIAAGQPMPSVLLGFGRAPRRTAAAGTGGGALARRLAGLGESEQLRVLLDLVRWHAAVVLGHGEASGIEAHQAFRNLGFDSLTAVELRNRLAAAAGLTLPATLVFDYPTPQALAGYLLRQALGRTTSAELTPAVRAAGEPIAVVAMACRFPGGVDSPEELWRLVADGVDATGAFPADRGWEDEPAGFSRVGGFLSGAADFDAEFFGISPREAVAMDPQQRLLLEVSWEALERAGLDPAGLRGSDTGIFAGLSLQDYAWRLAEADGGSFRLTGNASSVVSGRVAYEFGLEGPAVTVDTACSSSLVAMHLAAQALRNGECSMALAGGVTVMATPTTISEFALQGGLAADGRVKAFSGTADGTVLSEGIGVVVLERLSEAQRLGHPVLAVLKGSAVNQDGASNGLSAPNGPSQERVIRRALADARLTPADVDAVEGHGTGTTLGDPIEAQALLATYGQDRAEDQPLWLGSVKSNIGHAQAAAGVAGVIKMVEAMRRGLLPPTLHADEPSPHVDWTTGDVRLLTELRSWESAGGPRRAGVSSFGISGTNAHVILEAAPEPASRPASAPVVTGAVVPWAFSAKSEPALQALADRLMAENAAVEDVAVSLAASRTGLQHRGVLLEPGGSLMSGRVADSSGVAFVFPGQGSQWAGMGRELLACSPVFAAFVAECEQLTDLPLRDALVSGTGLDRVEIVQPALFVMMVGLAKVWEAAGVTPSAVVGHSQGELAAACFAGALSLPDALGLAVARSQALVALAGTGGMLSVAADPETVDGMLADGLVIAAINASRQVVVSGAPQALDELAARCEAAGIRARRVDVDYASHNPLVDPVREQLLAVPVSPRDGRLPFYSAVTGTLVDGAGLDAAYWWRNLREQVRFAQTVAVMPVAGFVEVSPHPVLVPGIEDRWAVGSLRRDDGGQRRLLTSLAEAWIHGATVEWSRLVPAGKPIVLPTYPFQHRRYWASGGVTGRGGAGHPLLDSAVPLADGAGWVFSGRVSTGINPWLADHAVSGTVLVPGAALAELVLFAGDRAGLPVIGEITFEQPFVLERAADVQVRVDGDRVSVFSRTGEQWVRHATATVTDVVQPVAGLDGQWPPSGAQTLAVDDAYEVMAARGYEYGPAFRGLQAAWRLGDDLYAEVELPVDEGFAIHPALLDATLHVLIAAADDGADIGLPFAWRDVQLHATGASALRVRLSPAGPDAVTLLAADGEGQPVVSAGSMMARPADTARVQAGPGSGLLTLEWVPTAAGSAPEQVWVRDWPESSGEPVLAVAEPADAVAALSVVQAWLAAGFPVGSRLAVRTRDAVFGLASPGVWGLVRSAMSEHPDAGLVLVDGDGPVEAALATGERELVLRDGAVLVPRLRRAAGDEGARPVFEPGDAVLVTGGTGTLGGLVARHLVAAYGVRNLVLVSRSGQAAPGAADLVAGLQEAGGSVRIVAADLSDRAAVDDVVAGIPGLAGIVHTAGITEDMAVTSLSEESLRRVLAGKADAARHLHEATAHLDLTMFVLFSSLAGLLGGPGQGNYAAANTYLDALATHRSDNGLPGVSIAWGLWEQRSALTGALSQADEARLARGGGVALSTGQALLLFDAALAGAAPVVAAGLDLSAARATAAGGFTLPAVLGDLVRAPRRAAARAQGGDSFDRRLAGLGAAERSRFVLDLVREHAAVVLGYDQAASIRADQAFRDLGFDSVTAVELRNRLATVTGLSLRATLVFDFPTSRTLAEHLLTQAIGAPQDPEEARIEAAIRAIPVSRLRDVGLLDILLELAAPPPGADGNGNGDHNGNGDRNGNGNGRADGNGNGRADGNGNGNGVGRADGNGHGNGNGRTNGNGRNHGDGAPPADQLDELSSDDLIRMALEESDD
ncbi:type I polyketide synthase [Actinoplanes sp. N902-109]|uniref:type I polyketide synthase n=1 Tax=Actinoplanes sp. (strain N902-109) TaxID=649831 RepID=UPI0003293990|nr:type I polyketide synthase [Actinoplanes sp. N902-109]AGL16509.1 ObsC [Actinoplanes sp. N902-109]